MTVRHLQEMVLQGLGGEWRILLPFCTTANAVSYGQFSFCFLFSKPREKDKKEKLDCEVGGNVRIHNVYDRSLKYICLFYFAHCIINSGKHLCQ